MFEVKDLKFKYPKNNDNTIRGINFKIEKGEIFGFLGPSGAGKSTTQKILIKLLPLYDGKITYMGKDLKEYNDNFYEDIGVGFEMPVHFSKLTAMENLEFFKNLYNTTLDIEPIMKKVGLWKDRNKKVSEYSKGMKMRLNFVRAMLSNPKVLFLDEPTNGLDPANTRIIKNMILDFKKNGGTVFLTTHLMGDAEELCDRVAFISDGKIMEVDTPRNLELKYGKKTVTIEYKDGNKIKSKEFPIEDLGKNKEFLELIENEVIETIHSGETTLEDIFIKVTGVSLDGEA